MPAEERCAERAKLAKAVARAISDAHARSREYQHAKNQQEDTGDITMVLEAARAVERVAVDAYKGHVRKHGCKS